MRNSTTLTRKRALREDQPLWSASPRISVVSRKSPSSRNFDVVIVGAGISGALMARALSGKSLSILIIDRREPVRGSSMASTAMIQHEIDVPLHKLVSMLGKKRAQRVWQRSASAVEDLVTLTTELDIRCDLQRKRTLFLSGTEYGARALQVETDARREAGIECGLLKADALLERYGIDRTAAIDSSISASANPAQLTAGVLRHVGGRGVEIVSGVEITDVRSHTHEVTLATADGTMIGARHVVFCTGYEFLESLANKSQKLVSTWALASRQRLDRPKWLDSYLVWEGSDPYLYFRSTPDGRIIVGGEDEDGQDEFDDPSKSGRKFRLLIEKLADLTGISIGKPAFTWSAAFGVTPDGLPMIGRVPGLTNVYSTMGFGGNGITFSQIAAQIISSAILGHQDADHDLFPFH